MEREMGWKPKSRERVYDFAGGPLQIVSVLELPEPFGVHYARREVAEYLPLSHGLALPADLTCALLDAGGEPFAEAEVGVVDGHPACVAIRAVAGNELTLRTLRGIRTLGKLVESAATSSTVRVVRADGELVGEHYIEIPGGRLARDPRDKLEAEVREGLAERAPRTITPEFLREVADVYRSALAQGTSTQRAIQARWPTTDANARRWVVRARRDGYLGQAPDQRRAGEQPATEGEA